MDYLLLSPTMLKIRLQRIGKKKQAHFRLVVNEHTMKPQGKYLELLGNYNPHTKKLNVKPERISYWRSKGAQLSPTANNLLINQNIITGEKMQSWRPKVKEAGVAEATKPAEVPAVAA